MDRQVLVKGFFNCCCRGIRGRGNCRHASRHVARLGAYHTFFSLWCRS
jgi:hypothetical protein